MNISLNQVVLVFVIVATTSSSLMAQDDRPDSQFQIVALQHIDAHDARETINELIVNRTARLSVDERSNSIMVMGTDDEISFVSHLLNQLDVPAKRKTENATSFSAYPFPDQQSLKRAYELVQTMLAGEPGVKMDIDPASSNLYLQGTQQQHQVASNLIKELTQTDRSPTPANVHVATYLIVDGNEVEDHLDQLKTPKGKLSQVLASASAKGLLDISQPLVASQISSLVSSAQPSESTEGKQSNHGYFENQSSGDWFEFRNDGMLRQVSKERYNLKSRVLISLNGKDRNQHVAEISGDIELPVDHPVLLSFSTIGGIDSAVIIILTSE